jgi:hypothetical protein
MNFNDYPTPRASSLLCTIILCSINSTGTFTTKNPALMLGLSLIAARQNYVTVINSQRGSGEQR